MQLAEPIRIISDLHFGHAASLIGAPDDLVPLFRGVATVIFNGDTVESRFLEERPQAQVNLEAIGNACLAEGARPIFLNGNHDPIASSASHLDLAGGAVLVTHGDMLFHDISPWSNEAQLMGEAHTEALSEMEDDAFHDFEKRLHASKRAALALELHKSTLPRGPLARIVTYTREAWPPWRPLQIVKCWFETPAKAVALARVFRPRARFIIIGHTHYSGIWQRGPRTIINTGSFLPVAGRFVADVAGNRLTIRKIVRTGRRFDIGAEVSRFEAGRIKAHEGY